MKYFLLFLGLLLFVMPIWLVFYHTARIKRDHFAKLSCRAIAKKQQKLKGRIFFSSLTLKKTLSALLKSKATYSDLLNLSAGRLSGAQHYLSNNKQELTSLELEAFLRPDKALSKLEKIVRQTENQQFLLTMAELYYANNDDDKARQYVENIDDKKADKFVQMRKKYLLSYFYMQDGDLLSASENCSQVINFFKKQNYLFEEAQAYFRLGTIYRISGMTDVAQTMLEAAAKIFESLRFEKLQADALGNLGMLMVADNQIDKAQDYFCQGLDIFERNDDEQGAGDIINQQALSALIEKQNKQAESLAKRALKKHKTSRNKQGEAFSYEILCHIFGNNKQWNDVIENASLAANYYKESNNSAAFLEAKFLEANAMFESNKEQKAETLLREIVEISKDKNSCFHVANAYNLLGLIFLKKGDLRRAKGLFQQSLDCEQKSNRLDGLAIGYANMALIEAKRGQSEQASKTLITAIEYAKAHGETELSMMLEKRLSKNQGKL